MKTRMTLKYGPYHCPMDIFVVIFHSVLSGEILKNAIFIAVSSFPDWAKNCFVSALAPFIFLLTGPRCEQVAE